MPNIPRLKTLLEYVEQLPPEQIRMDAYFCGTAACLMGHACSVFPGEFQVTTELFGKFILSSRGLETYPGRYFFELGVREWVAIFDSDIPNDQAVDNLRKHIEEWSSASYC